MKNLDKLIPFSEIYKKDLEDPEIRAGMASFKAYYETLKMIKEGREKSNLSQAALSERSGVPISIISKIENGKRNPTVETLAKLASGMGKKLEIRFV